MTCIMHRAATNSRHNAVRDSPSLHARAAASLAGTAR